MKIEHLYYFLVISNTKSINKAARKLFLSQQHLSRIVNSLEEDLQITLLTRTSTGIELTEKGKIFSRYAEKIVDDYREMQNYFYLDALPALEPEEELKGSCRIAFPFFFSLFLNDFIKELHQIYPGIHIRYFEESGNYSFHEIATSNMLHVVVEVSEQLQELVENNSELAVHYIGETGISFCVNRNSPLAKKAMLMQSDIDTQLVTSYPQKASNSTMLKNANILFTSANIHQHLDSVVHNNSICFVPTYIQAGIEKLYPDVMLLPFEQQFTVPIYIMYSQSMELTASDKAVIQFAAQYMQKLNKAANMMRQE